MSTLNEKIDGASSSDDEQMGQLDAGKEEGQLDAGKEEGLQMTKEQNEAFSKYMREKAKKPGDLKINSRKVTGTSSFYTSNKRHRTSEHPFTGNSSQLMVPSLQTPDIRNNNLTVSDLWPTQDTTDVAPRHNRGFSASTNQMLSSRQSQIAQNPSMPKMRNCNQQVGSPQDTRAHNQNLGPAFTAPIRRKVENARPTGASNMVQREQYGNQPLRPHVDPTTNKAVWQSRYPNIQRPDMRNNNLTVSDLWPTQDTTDVAPRHNRGFSASTNQILSSRQTQIAQNPSVPDMRKYNQHNRGSSFSTQQIPSEVKRNYNWQMGTQSSVDPYRSEDIYNVDPQNSLFTNYGQMGVANMQNENAVGTRNQMSTFNVGPQHQSSQFRNTLLGADQYAGNRSQRLHGHQSRSQNIQITPEMSSYNQQVGFSQDTRTHTFSSPMEQSNQNMGHASTAPRAPIQRTQVENTRPEGAPNMLALTQQNDHISLAEMRQIVDDYTSSDVKGADVDFDTPLHQIEFENTIPPGAPRVQNDNQNPDTQPPLEDLPEPGGQDDFTNMLK